MKRLTLVSKIACSHIVRSSYLKHKQQLRYIDIFMSQSANTLCLILLVELLQQWIYLTSYYE